MKMPKLTSWVTVPTSAPTHTAVTDGPLNVFIAKVHYTSLSKTLPFQKASQSLLALNQGQPGSEKPQEAKLPCQRAKGSRLGLASRIPPAVPGRGPLPASLMFPLEAWEGISAPPTPHIFTDGQEALQGKEGWINIHTLVFWLWLCPIPCDLPSLIYNAQAGASGSRSG